jgi:coiled-coil domain-containing protein 102A
LRHSYNKCKKALQERNAELDHAKSRAEQYETDVKKLRMRIDELKHELASAEDEVR